MSNGDLVSVIVPAYNAEKTLSATLRSIRKQTYRNLEIVVVNDGSTDDTKNIAARHATEDERIRVISTSNGGVAKARNTGIDATTGPFVAMLDADDLWHPEKIARQIHAMTQGDTDLGYVYCLSRRIDEGDRDLGPLKTHPFEGRIFLRSIIFNPVGNGSAILARRSVLEQVGGFEIDRDLQEDNLLQIMMNRKWKARVVPQYLLGYRVMTGSRSSDLDRAARGRLGVLQRVAERFPETPRAVLSLAEARTRAILAAQAFRQNKIPKGVAEVARACRLAPLYTLEFLAVDLVARLRGGARSIRARNSRRDARPGKTFLDCDPKATVARPYRRIERRRLDAIAAAEEAFFQSNDDLK